MVPLLSISSVLNTVGSPAFPITEPWEVSIASLLARHTTVPSAMAKGLSILDRFGAVRLTPKCIGFDNDDIAWKDVVEIRTAPLRVLLSQTALDCEMQRLRTALPPVPGRKWLVTQIGACVSSMVERATAAQANDRPEVVGIVLYRGRFGRQRSMPAGAAAASILGAVPDSTRVVVATAREPGIAVRTQASS